MVDDCDAWFRKNEGEKKSATVDLGGRIRELAYTAIGDLGMFEGDIVLGRVAELEKPVGYLGIGVKDKKRLWPGGRVPYQIDPDLPNPERVTEALAAWAAVAKLEFVERTGPNAAGLRDYISFESRDGCWSHVGRQGGEQVISLGPGCGVGTAIHELGHALGLWHEQSRADRDEWITVEWENIEPRHAHNFNQHVKDGVDLGDYDYASIMHYPAKAFSRNGKPTIVPKQGSPHIGQRKELSEGDVAAIRKLYS